MSDRLKIKELDAGDRPREKMIAHGADALSNAELIAILMGSGTVEMSAIDLAAKMLADNGHRLRELGRRSIKQMKEYKGVGDAKAVTILAALELAKRYAGERNDDTAPTLDNSSRAYEHMRLRLRDLPDEQFWITALSNAKRPLYDARVSDGGINFTPVDVRKVMRYAIERAASAILLYHNHPSGTCRPSRQDDELTRRIVEAGRVLGIPVVDHIIVAGDSYYSYNDDGRL